MKNKYKHSISVVIPCYNSEKTLVYTFNSLIAQKEDYINEVIVVDSSEKNITEKLVDEYNKTTRKIFKYVRSGIRIMPAIGRNVGAKQAKGSILLFLDSDVILKENYIEQIIKAHSEGALAGGGGILIPEFQKKSFLVAAQHYLQLNEYLDAGKKRIKEIIPGCNIFCDKKIFNNVGGFPEIRASEDTMFCLNVKEKTDIWFIPDANVSHIYREEWKGFIRNQILLGKYISIYRKKNSRSLLYKSFFPVILAPAIYSVKHLIILRRIVKAGYKHNFNFVRVFPIFSFGIFCWTLGFVKGCFSKN